MRQVLTFLLDQERYGLDISSVQEIAEAQRCYFIPNAPSFYQGAINIHGSILPVIDLARLLGFEGRDRDARVIVLDAAVGQMALAVSRMLGIISLAPGDHPPQAPGGQSQSCIRELCRAGDDLINLLDIRLLLSRLATR